MSKPPAFLLMLVYLCIWPESANSLTSCTQKSACSCESEDGLIDLSPLATHGSTPKLQATHVQDLFYYNPCYNFDIGTVKDAAVVQYQQEFDQYFATGSNKEVTMSIQGQDLQIKLAGTDPRSTTIKVLCGTSVEFMFISESETNEYTLELTAPEGCPSYVPPSGSSGLSVGSVMVIVFFGLLVCYIGFGVAVQVFVRKAHGKERIPNVDFWSHLSGLIKDGVLFTFTCGKRSSHYTSV